VAPNRLTKPRIVLADDNRCMLLSIAQALSSWCEVEVVGHALNGAEAAEAVFRLQPDIVILDIVMPVLDGIQAARKLREADSPVRIIFLTAIEDPSTRKAAMEAGGQAYVSKFQLITDLPRAITAVMEGGTFFSSQGKGR
jgi:DNA-binding NarL/FixJ family response regulator